ncbi:hypothetical protein CFN78_10670 [Amycolatopsis antarctica]|uniref:Uncharacterized protein n=1 Tax=Amycolatopsis antarctica TaxID=1854586 RepID=A0A263D534_9PSEU|nr:hypothetical protein [Amycolatopsis antarctica]OZM73309.1 hypothetical protein CFN78_10670 [Amycolatopsis antarctica]
MSTTAADGGGHGVADSAGSLVSVAVRVRVSVSTTVTTIAGAGTSSVTVEGRAGDSVAEGALEGAADSATLTVAGTAEPPDAGTRT